MARASKSLIFGKKKFELEVMLPCYLRVRQMCSYYTKLNFVKIPSLGLEPSCPRSQCGILAS